MIPIFVARLPKKGTNSAASASVIFEYAASQYANASLIAETISAFDLAVFSMPFSGAFPSATTPQNSYCASATCANNCPMVRTSGVGLNDHVSSGTLSAERRMSLLAMPNMAWDVATSGFFGTGGAALGAPVWAERTAANVIIIVVGFMRIHIIYTAAATL